MRLFLRSILALILVGAPGCSTGEPAKPVADEALQIGPAPLRRLSNDEYRNALRDLFPDLHPVLPELPHDTAVAGFENAAESQEPSDVRISRFEEIADLHAAAATADGDAVRALTGCAEWSNPTVARGCATTFVEQLGRRLFRRPITKDERDRFVERFVDWETAVAFEGAARLTLSAMLQSPQFLYRVEPIARGVAVGSLVPVEPYAMASRLSFLLWGSIPDERLIAAAGRDELQTEAQIRTEAKRMLRDRRARRVFWDFHRQWLGLDRILQDEHVVRTPEVDAAWTPASQLAASRESELFVENVLAEGGTFEDLWTSRRAWTNSEMARLYGVPFPRDPDAWIETALPDTERAGLLTRIAFLASHSHRGATSPPVRGNGIQLRLLCRLPVSPPADADLSQPTPAPGQGPQTNRMLFEARTSPGRCQACHAGLNGLGFGLENYNAAGHYQTSENGLAIDGSGVLLAPGGPIPFVGGVGLSESIARSEAVRSCATEQWVRYAFGRAAVDVERPLVAELTRRFMDSRGDIQALLLDIATAPSFRLRRVEAL